MFKVGKWAAIAASAAGVGAVPGGAAAAPDYDFDWVSIGNTGNGGYDGPVIPGREWVLGRGSVGYEYRISKLEITTAQWMEYINTFTTQSQSMAFFIQSPANWGAQSDLSYLGPGRRYQLGPDPNAATFPVGGISWREAARYCNWLHNGKSSDVDSLVTGAYDTTTWGNGPTPGTYTDAPTRLPGARFFIPSFDEWLKSAHYDPVKFGQGEGGWWLYSNQSDTTAPVGGFPGAGTTSAGTGHWFIPLAMYPQTTSAYGLLDLSGGAREWLEDYAAGEEGRYRLFDGASIGDFLSPLSQPDNAWTWGSDPPVNGYSFNGLRIASEVPAPRAACVAVVAMLRCTRRRGQHADVPLHKS